MILRNIIFIRNFIEILSAMKTKLTLNIDDAVIEKVKAVSKKRKISISAMVENYFESILDLQIRKKTEQKSFTQRFRKLTRAVTISDKELESMRYEHIKTKHGPKNIS